MTTRINIIFLYSVIVGLLSAQVYAQDKGNDPAALLELLDKDNGGKAGQVEQKTPPVPNVSQATTKANISNKSQPTASPTLSNPVVENEGKTISAGEGDVPAKGNVAPAPAAAPAAESMAKSASAAVASGGQIATMSQQVSPPAVLPAGTGSSTPVAPPKIKDPFAWEGSVMFLAKDIQDIEQAIMNYDLSELDKKIREQQFQSLFVDPNQKKVEIPPAPVFYLSALVYDTPTTWTVWINDDRIPAKDKDTYVKNGLRISNVEKDVVTFTWETDVLDLMVPEWQTKLDKPERKPQSAQKNPVSVKELLDQNKKRLEFTLRPNQSFVVARMSIIEGKLREVIPPPTQDQIAAALPRSTPDQLNNSSGSSWTDLPKSSTEYVPPAGLPSQGGSDVDPTEKYRGMRHIQEKTPTPGAIEQNLQKGVDAQKLIQDVITTPQQ